MITEYENPTIQILIDDKIFNCHITVLQCYSEYFKDKTLEHTVRLPIEQVTPIAFIMVYDWMLADDPKVQRQGILQLFKAAEFLQIKELIAQCWVCFDNENCLSEDAAFIIYLESRELGLKKFQHLFLNRISKFYLSLVASDEFLDFDLDELCILLQSSFISVNSETEVFMSAVRWLNYDWETRSAHLIPVMKCIRFGLMASFELIALNKQNSEIDDEEVKRVTDNQEVQDMIKNGLGFVTIQSWKSLKFDEYIKLLEDFHYTEPNERQWIQDKTLTDLHCVSKLAITYSIFLQYLEMIRSMGANHWKTLENCKSRATIVDF